MRKGLNLLGIFFAIATIGGFIQSNISGAIGMLLMSVVSFWRASKSKKNVAWEIVGFICAFLTSGGIIMIAKEGLFYPGPQIFILIATIVCFYLCDRNSTETQPEAKPESDSVIQSPSTIVHKTTTTTYIDESIENRLKRLCNPMNFMENYNKENVEIANQIYSKLMDSNFNVDEIAAEAEKRLGIQLVDAFQIEDLKDKLHPKNFMNPYDAQKISLANELYSRIIDNITYSEFVILKNDAKPILDLYTTTKVDLGLVDLGLSVKWAKYNIGASKPEEQGDFFAWGEINPKSEYSWKTYKHGKIRKDEIYLTKYCNDAYYGYVDNQCKLNKNDDVAYKTIGERWRIPTDAEWTELKEQCTWTWITKNGVDGFEVKALNGNSIFLPANVCWAQPELDYDSCYWSSSIDDDYPILAWSVCIKSCEVMNRQNPRCHGFSVRAVLDEKS